MPFRTDRRPAEDDLRLLCRATHEALDALELLCTDQRAHLCGLVRCCAHLDRLHLLLQQGDELFVRLWTHHDAAGGGAVLPRIPEAGGAHRLRGQLQVRVIEDEDGRLSTELEVESLDALGACGGDPLPRCRVAGDRNHVDAGMSRECRTDIRTRPRDHVQDAGRQDLLRQSAEHQRADRCAGRRLEHDRVSSGERGADLPARHQERIVPRRDGGDHADRIATDHARAPREILGDRLPLQVARGAGKVAKVVYDRVHLHANSADRLPCVLRFCTDERTLPRFECVSELQEREAALARGRVRPRWKGGARRGDRRVDVLLAAVWHRGDLRPR